MSLPEQEFERALDAELAAVPDVDFDQEPDDTVVPDDETAHRMALAYRLTTRDIETAKAVASRRKDEIDGWLTRWLVQPTKKAAWYSAALEHYTRHKVGRKTKGKFIDTPSGRLKLGATPGKVVVEDADALLLFALQHGTDDAPALWHETKWVPVLDQIKALTQVERPENLDGNAVSDFMFEGEKVPGVTFVKAARDKFSITLPKGSAQEDDDE
jgi:hypothetical protein